VIYRDGNKVDADGTVTVQMYNADDSTNTLLTSGSAYNEPYLGLYSFEVSPSITLINRVLKILWSYTVNGNSTTETNYVEIVTPYATVSDILDYYGFGTRPQDNNYKSHTQITNMEKLARTVINGYTGQQFSLRYGSQEVVGNGSDGAWLTEPVQSVDSMYENGILVYSASSGSVTYNTFGFGLEITQTSKVVRIINNSWDVRYDNQVDPTVLYYGRFRDQSRYKFTGLIGWNYVPQDVKLATILLAGDYMSNDAAWRIKYLNKISMSEVSFEMKAGAYNGTGNLIVDNILDQYRNVGIVVI
jgi:hypothetical protein